MKHCNIEGCMKEPVAKGLCELHYRRLRRHGDPTKGRPQHWGKAEKHPLYDRHQYFKRQRALCDEWLDFWEFVRGIGDVPQGYRIYRKNVNEPLSSSNNLLKKSVSSKNKAKYARKWRAANPDKAKNSELKRSFGITLDTYNTMLENQNGVCAICKRKDTSFDSLAVDHDHDTGQVRGLLCHLCNRALGLFKDNKANLEQAVRYLNNN